MNVRSIPLAIDASYQYAMSMPCAKGNCFSLCQFNLYRSFFSLSRNIGPSTSNLKLTKIVIFRLSFSLFALFRVASMPNTGVEEEYYRLRHFSITGKGVINRGDSLKSRRSRSNNSVASSNSR